MTAPRTVSRRSVLGGLASTGVAAAGVASAAPVGGQTGRSAQQGGQSPDGPLADPEAFESFLDGAMKTQLDAHDVAGATVAVVDGEETFTKGYGYSDVAAREPVDGESTLFRIGSVSKLFAWTVAMQAVERGDLATDVDVNRYLDDLSIPDTYDDPVTLDHLSTHTAGFEDRFRGTFVPDAESLQPIEEVLRE